MILHDFAIAWRSAIMERATNGKRINNATSQRQKDIAIGDILSCRPRAMTQLPPQNSAVRHSRRYGEARKVSKQ